MNFQHQFQQGDGQQQQQPPPQHGEIMMDQNGQLVVVQMQPQGMQPMAMPFSFDYMTLPAGMVYGNMQPVMPPPPPPRVDHSVQVSPMLATPYMASAMDSVRKVVPPVIPPPMKPSTGSAAGPGGDKPSSSPQPKKPKAEKKEKDSSSSTKSSSKAAKQTTNGGKSKSAETPQQAGGTSASTAATTATSKPKPKKRPAAAAADKDEKKPSTADSTADSAKSSPTKSPTKKRRKPAAGDKSSDAVLGSSDKASVSAVDKENGPISDEPEAYAKLDCMNLVDKSRFEKYITFLPCVIGREDPSLANKIDNQAQKLTTATGTNNANVAEERFISLGNSRTIGRRHAQIHFNYSTGFYEITVFGSNKALVRGEIVKCTEGVEEGKTVPLYPGDPVKIGDVGFYFCMPDLERPKKIFAELTVEALESAKSHGMMQRTAKEIAEYIIAKPEYAYYNVLYGNEKAILTLIRSIQNAISKSDKIVSSSKDKAGKALYSVGTKVVPGKKEKGEKQSGGETKQASSSGGEDSKQTSKKEGASTTLESSNKGDASSNPASMQVESTQSKEASLSQGQDES